MLVENHRHLAGSITPETIWEIISHTTTPLWGHRLSLEYVRQQVYLMRDDADFDYFCSRFDILNKIEWNDWALYKTARQVLFDIKTGGIDWCTLTVSLNKFVKSDDLIDTGYRVFSILDVITKELGVNVNFLLSISYNWPIELQLEMLNLIDHLENFISGVDFVGDESLAKWSEYTEPLNKWKAKDKTIRVHVAERPGTSNNISLAMMHMDITRIAHGIYATKEQQVEATRRGIVFDMAIHSNIYTHAIELTKHPIKQMQEAGCLITIGTDDPVQFSCTLQNEYALAEAMGANKELLRQTAITSKIR